MVLTLPCRNTHAITQFYLDDLEDELTTTALRMLVKDLLILFQAGNEGVINVLGMILSHCWNRSLVDRHSLLQSTTLKCHMSTLKRPWLSTDGFANSASES